MTAVRSDGLSRCGSWYLQTPPWLLVCIVLPGCVIQNMRDEVAATRASVERIENVVPELRDTNAALRTSSAHIEQLYREVLNAHVSLRLVLDRLDATNANLQTSAQQLRSLDPMMGSLNKLDESLAALRRMVENIDKAVPLLNFSRGTQPVEKVTERPAGQPKDAVIAPESQMP